MIAQHSEDVVLAVCLVVVAVSMTALWLLAKPTSRLSRWVDREIDKGLGLPATTTAGQS